MDSSTNRISMENISSHEYSNLNSASFNNKMESQQHLVGQQSHIDIQAVNKYNPCANNALHQGN